jgi:flagellar biosynthesis protein
VRDLERYRKLASALTYDLGEDFAPRVVASGKGRIAERILELAREYDVPVREDPVLAEALAALTVGDLIPPQLYQAVAEVLAFVYRLDSSRAGQRREV